MLARFLLLSTAIAMPAVAQTVPARAGDRAEAMRPAEPAVAPAAAPHMIRTTMRRDGMDATIDGRAMRLTALALGAIRVQVAGADGRIVDDGSWAVLDAARRATAPATATATGFAAAGMTAAIDPATGLLTIADADGRTLLADAAPFETREHGFALAKAMPADAHYFGLGDKTGPLDRRGRAFTMWNTDSGITETEDPIYKSIPWVIQVTDDGRAAGLLVDNSFRGSWDFGKRDAGVLAIDADGGVADYYVVAGPTAKDVVERYAKLTGPSPLPPLWALGFQQSRYSYMSAQEVRGIVDRFRRDRLPLDAIWLDIDYQDRNRPFTVNTRTFPDMAGMVRDVKAQGVQTIVITDLHIAAAPNQGYAPYDGGVAGGHFVRKADGGLYVGPVWPGPAVFPDFTRAATRAWWGGLYKDFLKDGIAGFWNDMNEPSVFVQPDKTMPLDNLHRVEGPGFTTRTATHAEIHNLMGLANTMATHDGLLALRPDERPFVMTRASYAGGQRYAVTWTGDNASTWSQLHLATPMLLNLGMSGFAWAGADVGGFGGSPSPELLTRWIEVGAFQPIFRDHSANDTAYQEPWVHGPEQEAIRRRYIEERYRLLPYLYSVADEVQRTGLPFVRPMFLEFPKAINAGCRDETSFMVGSRLLVAPPPYGETPAWYDVCLPAGGWVDYWTGKPVQTTPRTDFLGRPAGERLTEKPTLERLPVFVRAGTILPRQPLVQSTGEIPQGPLELAVYPGADCAGTLYADDGHSLSYARGAYLRQTVRCSGGGAAPLAIAFDAAEGRYRPWWRELSIVVHGWTKDSARVTAGGRTLPATVDTAAGTVTVRMPYSSRRGTIEIS